MLKKKSFQSAFTLIELLVVITIIGILAGIALPVFNSVQIRGSQTKVLAQAKQVGLALKLFAADNSGSYPVYQGQTPYGGGTASGANNANEDFFPLFPTYTQSESIFANKYDYYNNVVPDNVTDPAGQGKSQTLKNGECAFSYMEGLTDNLNPASAIVMDGGKTDGTYTNTPNTAGYVWGTNKAIVVHLDNSASLDTLATKGSSATNATYEDDAPDPNSGNSTPVNILNPKTNTSLTGCFLVTPVRG